MFGFAGILGIFLCQWKQRRLGDKRIFCFFSWLLANNCVACLSFDVWVGVFLTLLISCDVPFHCIISCFFLGVSLKFVLKNITLMSYTWGLVIDVQRSILGKKETSTANYFWTLELCTVPQTCRNSYLLWRSDVKVNLICESVSLKLISCQ